jgi:Tfp pilus assembly protein PilO
MRYFILLIFIGASIGVFATIIKPRYDALQSARADVAVSDASLSTASKLKSSREELITRYNSIPKADLDNIKTLLPDSVDNIRLIIQLDSLATKNGLSTLRNVDYQSTEEKKTTAPSGVTTPAAQKLPYGEFVISFQTVGQYKNFLAFLSDLEQNLRVVDVTGVEFSTNELNPGLTTNMLYTVTLKTYWLKQ